MQIRLLKQRGFSLIELMVVVVIVSVIAAIAIPSYKKYVVDTRRTEAQSALLAFANAMERHKLRTGTYLDVASTNTLGSPTIFPTQAPLNGTPKVYDLRVTFTATEYTLFAIPIAGDLQDGDGKLRLTHTGQRAWDEQNDDTYLSDW